MKIIFVFIAGNIGVGKTTTARLIAQILGATHVDIDGFKALVVDPSTVSDTIDPLDMRNRYCQLAIAHHLKNSSGVIVMDEIFPFKGQRLFASQRAREAGADVIWVNVVAREEISLGRLTRPRGDHLLDIVQARRLHNEFEGIFEPFASDEPHIRIENNGDDPQRISIPEELLSLVGQ